MAWGGISSSSSSGSSSSVSFSGWLGGGDQFQFEFGFEFEYVVQEASVGGVGGDQFQFKFESGYVMQEASCSGGRGGGDEFEFESEVQEASVHDEFEFEYVVQEASWVAWKGGSVRARVRACSACMMHGCIAWGGSSARDVLTSFFRDTAKDDRPCSHARSASRFKKK